VSTTPVAGLDENQVVDAVAAFLTSAGWVIEQKLHGHQRGVDVIARRRDQLLHVEAKGGTSTRATSANYGKRMSSGEVKINVDEAFATAAIACARRGVLSAVAFPDDARHRKRADPLRPALDRLGIGVFWVAHDSTVTLEAPSSLSGRRADV
jgi:hypothetical protein